MLRNFAAFGFTSRPLRAMQSAAGAAPQGAAFLHVGGALGELALQAPRPHANRGLRPHLPADCSRTVREMRGRPRPSKSRIIPFPRA